jgi:DNA-binding Xre family transcriptional regulator
MTAPRVSASGRRRPASGITIDIKRLTRMREEKSWDRSDLAKAAGLSESMISKIEIRARKPRAATLAAICAALGCEPGDLLT